MCSGDQPTDGRGRDCAADKATTPSQGRRRAGVRGCRHPSGRRRHSTNGIWRARIARTRASVSGDGVASYASCKRRRNVSKALNAPARSRTGQQRDEPRDRTLVVRIEGDCLSGACTAVGRSPSRSACLHHVSRRPDRKLAERVRSAVIRVPAREPPIRNSRRGTHRDTVAGLSGLTSRRSAPPLLAYSRSPGRCRRDSSSALFWPELDTALAVAPRAIAGFLARARLDGILMACDRAIGRAATVGVTCGFDRPAGGQAAQALQLYRGAFLDGCFVIGWLPELERWLRAERTRSASLRSGRRLTWWSTPSGRRLPTAVQAARQASPSILTTRVRSRGSSRCWTGAGFALAR